MSRQMTTRQGDLVDQIALEVYGRTAGATEAILNANPHLEGQPPHLPAGLVIVLPEIDAQPVTATVRLWD